MNPWALVYDGFDPSQQGLREALCTLGNGFFATRGARPEAVADDIHYPGTYLAGGYNRLTTEIAGRTVENEDLVNMPNWLPLTFRIENGNWFNLLAVELLSYRQELDLYEGVLQHDILFEDAQSRRTRVASRQLVHMEDPHYAALETTITPENWAGSLTVRSGLDGRVVNGGVERYRNLNNKHLLPVEAHTLEDEFLYLKAQTVQSLLYVALAARTRVYREGVLQQADRRDLVNQACVGQEIQVHAEKGRPITFEKVAALFTSGDRAISECGQEARKAIRRARSFNELLESHTRAWRQLWRLFDLEIERDTPDNGEETELILHLHLFHLLQTVCMNSMDLDVGVPARGWHGEAYRGHIFWDELFIFPILNFRVPEITRALLKYRYRRLNEAREAASRAGYRGAMYPWQSGSSGREESQILHLNPKSGRWIPDNTHLQRHVNAAIAYNIHQYFQVTRDMEFLSFYGAEMILEIARFWASIARYNAALDRYEILKVMGPDEYHDHYPGAGQPGLNNNAYTNIMAVWVLCCALEVLDLLSSDLRRELRERLDLTDKELAHWREVSTKMRVVFHGDGIVSQFEGYDRLEEFDWEKYNHKYGEIKRLDRILEAENDTPNRYKASKQADVLMLFYLFSSEELQRLFKRLGYPFQYETIPKNIDYYIQRTSNGSTLSQIVHSWVLGRSDRPRAWRLFNQALHTDLQDVQGGTTPEGIHLGAMAGTVDLLKRGFTGMELRGQTLYFNPQLPEDLKRLCLRIRYRGHSLELHLTRESLEVVSKRCTVKPIEIGFREEVRELKGGESLLFNL